MKKYTGQSYKWARYTVHGVDSVSRVSSVRLLVKKSGNHTEIFVEPGGTWHGIQLSWSGKIAVSKYSAGKTLQAVANTGNWSGGGNYDGWLFGQPGAVFWLACKGLQKWMVFTETGVEEHETNPFKKPVEI